MSKYLVDPTVATPSAPKKPQPRARLLTSALTERNGGKGA